MRISNTIGNISVAILNAQRKMGGASKDASNPYFKSKYSDYNSVLEVVKGPLNDEGVTVIQSAYSDAAGHYVETLLMHSTGEFISSGPLRLELNKVTMQDLGSAVTYARRYQLQALLSIPSVDDDAETSMNRKKTETKAPEAPAADLPKSATRFNKPPRSAPVDTGTVPAAPKSTNLF